MKNLRRALRLFDYRDFVAAIFLCLLFMLGILIGVLVPWTSFWAWLSDGESGSAILRNLGLVAAGLIALPLALWRSFVAHRQSQTAQQGLLNERYQKGAEMLGSEVLSVRLGGIYALQRLAEEHPEQYHLNVMQIFCAFLRHPTKDNAHRSEQMEFDPHTFLGLRQDIDAALLAICSRRESEIEIERKNGFGLDLRGTVFSGVELFGADLSNAMLERSELIRAIIRDTDLTDTIFDFADLTEVECNNVKFTRTRFILANLQGVSLQESDITRCDFYKANLEYANLSQVRAIGADFGNGYLAGASFLDADLEGAELADANLSGVEFSNKGHQAAKGLTQAQLDQARADPNNPPKLEGVLDAETGEPLVWRGESVQSK